MRYTTKNGLQLDKREVDALTKARDLTTEIARLERDTNTATSAKQADDDLTALVKKYTTP